MKEGVCALRRDFEYSTVNTGAYSTLSVSVCAQSLPSQVASCTKEERASVVPVFKVSVRSFLFPGAGHSDFHREAIGSIVCVFSPTPKGHDDRSTPTKARRKSLED